MKNKFFIILLFLFFISIFLSQNNLSFYDIIEDFDLFFENNFLVFYSIFKDKPERYFIYGYYPDLNKVVSFIRPNEFGRSKYFPNDNYYKFAYFSTYEGNDILWIKDVANEVGYRLVFNISGYIRKVHFSYDEKFVVLSFLYLDPTYYLYIAGIEEDYIYPVGFIPEIIEIFSSNNFIYVLFKENYKFNLAKIYPLNKDEINQRKKVNVEYIFRDIKDLVFYNSNFILYKKEENLYLFNIKNEKFLEGKNYKVIKRKEEDNINENLLIFDKIFIYKDKFGILDSNIIQNINNYNSFYIEYPYILFDNRYLYKVENDKYFIYLLDLYEFRNYFESEIFKEESKSLNSYFFKNIDDTFILLFEKVGKDFTKYYFYMLNISKKEIKRLNDENVENLFKQIKYIKKVRNSNNFLYFLCYIKESFGFSTILFRIKKENLSIETIFDYNYVEQKYLKYYLKK